MDMTQWSTFICLKKVNKHNWLSPGEVLVNNVSDERKCWEFWDP